MCHKAIKDIVNRGIDSTYLFLMLEPVAVYRGDCNKAERIITFSLHARKCLGMLSVWTFFSQSHCGICHLTRYVISL